MKIKRVHKTTWKCHQLYFLQSCHWVTLKSILYQKCSYLTLLGLHFLRYSYVRGGHFCRQHKSLDKKYARNVRSRINAKKLYRKKSQWIKLKNLPQASIFFIFALQFSNSCKSFKLVQRVFCDGSITFLEINLVPILL